MTIDDDVLRVTYPTELDMANIPDQLPLVLAIINVTWSKGVSGRQLRSVRSNKHNSKVGGICRLFSMESSRSVIRC